MTYPPKGRYRHYKGGEYELLYIARHSETDEPLVVYRALNPCPDTPLGEGVWARPLSMWTETVTVNGRPCPRFEYLGPCLPSKSDPHPAHPQRRPHPPQKPSPPGKAARQRRMICPNPENSRAIPASSPPIQPRPLQKLPLRGSCPNQKTPQAFSPQLLTPN